MLMTLWNLPGFCSKMSNQTTHKHLSKLTYLCTLNSVLSHKIMSIFFNLLFTTNFGFFKLAAKFEIENSYLFGHAFLIHFADTYSRVL